MKWLDRLFKCHSGFPKEEFAWAIARKGDVIVLETKRRLREEERESVLAQCNQAYERMGVSFVLLEHGIEVAKIRKEAS